MVRPIHILLLSSFSMTLAHSGFSDPGNIQHGLHEQPDALLNRQGLAQYDLSIRGSSYPGAGISLNGLNLRTPYSAHFNTDLPFPAYLLSDPVAQTGLANVSGHLVGTAAYTTVPQEQNGSAGAAIGTKEHYSSGISSFSSGAGGFLEGEKARRIDYRANDLKRQAGGVYLQHIANDWQIDLIGAHQQKEFGAQGYYGIPSSVYAQEQTEDTLIFFGATKGELDDSFLRVSTAWRQFDDEYLGPTSYDVRSRMGAALIEGRTMEIQHLAVTLRGDINHEQVDGTTGSHDRTRGSMLILPEARLESFIIKAGFNTVVQTSESAEWLPQAGIDWLASDNTILYSAYSETVQQPDFQTLAANPALELQQAQNTELGIRQFISANLNWRATAFHRRMEHTTDRIGGTALDLGVINVYGVESELIFRQSDRLELQGFYQWIHKDNSRTDGFYELDYPEHLLHLSAFWKICPALTAECTQLMRWQTDTDARTSNDFGSHAFLGLHYRPRFANNMRLSFRVDNLWGSNFQALPGLKPRPATVSSGITVVW